MKMMRLPTGEFIRRFLIHVLPSGFHRMRHTGFLANGVRCDRVANIRRLLDTEPKPNKTPEEIEPEDPNSNQPCPKCGGTMIVIETFLSGQTPKSRIPPWEDVV